MKRANMKVNDCQALLAQKCKLERGTIITETRGSQIIRNYLDSPEKDYMFWHNSGTLSRK